MTPLESQEAPTLPFPIFQLSQNIHRYMLYDIDLISWLRRTHNILGVLIGSLPQNPQQNVFLGLPLELQPEEARLLVDQGLAYVVDDLDWHTKDLATKDAAEVGRIKTDMRKQGMEIAREFQKSKQGRTQKALQRIRDKDGTRKDRASTASPIPETKHDSSEETLLGESLTRENILTSSVTPSLPSESELGPWAITPTTSYPPLTQPAKTSPPILPKVNPASYALFAHLHGLGYFIAPGIRFGCQFSVYPGDPLRFHSHFLSMSYDWDEEIDLLDLVGGGRLGTGVKKGWLIGGKAEGTKDGEESHSEAKVRTFCIEWGGM